MHAVLMIMPIVTQRLVIEDAPRYVSRLKLTRLVAPRRIDLRYLIDGAHIILGFSAAGVDQRLNGLLTPVSLHQALLDFRAVILVM